MKSLVLHTVWCYISGEVAGEIWNWSLSGVKGFMWRNSDIITWVACDLPKVCFICLVTAGDRKPTHTDVHPTQAHVNTLAVDCTQPLSFLLVIERLERARCATARETGISKVDGRARFSARLCLSLAPVPHLLWTRTERGCVQSTLAGDRNSSESSCRCPLYWIWGAAISITNYLRSHE